MKIKLCKDSVKSRFLKRIEVSSGETLANCYQCGNCTAGCPVSYAMDMGPAQIIRLLQFGQERRVLEANSMWVCVGCFQCYSRCPKGVSAAAVFEALRQLTLRRGFDHKCIGELSSSFIERTPQQAMVCGFRKFVS